ncbi:hypothetical protein C8T65DRAFT_744502 [Cerioporus squamosus]|nr:hypothetical protein C8T65DRAFT_744502 [Cerioporus squamosus]
MPALICLQSPSPSLCSVVDDPVRPSRAGYAPPDGCTCVCKPQVVLASLTVLSVVVARLDSFERPGYAGQAIVVLARDAPFAARKPTHCPDVYVERT